MDRAKCKVDPFGCFSLSLRDSESSDEGLTASSHVSLASSSQSVTGQCVGYQGLTDGCDKIEVRVRAAMMKDML